VNASFAIPRSRWNISSTGYSSCTHGSAPCRTCISSTGRDGTRRP
jgi:hypothetical protein